MIDQPKPVSARIVGLDTAVEWFEAECKSCLVRFSGTTPVLAMSRKIRHDKVVHSKARTATIAYARSQSAWRERVRQTNLAIRAAEREAKREAREAARATKPRRRRIAATTAR